MQSWKYYPRKYKNTNWLYMNAVVKKMLLSEQTSDSLGLKLFSDQLDLPLRLT